MDGIALNGRVRSGVCVLEEFCDVVQAIISTVASSFGPKGHDKLVADDNGEYIVTNDGATILSKLDRSHPAADLIIKAAFSQDMKHADGTTSIAILAGALIKRAFALIESNQFHPTAVVRGYTMATNEATKFLIERCSETQELTPAYLGNLIQTCMASKILANHQGKFVEIFTEAAITLGTKLDSRLAIVPVVGNRSVESSHIERGVVLNRISLVAPNMPKKLQNGKVAIIDFKLARTRMHLHIKVKCTDPAEINQIREEEVAILKKKLDKLIDAGADVIVSTEGFDEIAIQYLAKRGIAALRRVEKLQAIHLRDLTGAKIIYRIGDDDELFDPSWLGSFGSFQEYALGAWTYTSFTPVNLDEASSLSLMLYAPNEFLSDEYSRCIQDVIGSVASSIRDNCAVVRGAGCVEAALACHLKVFAEAIHSSEQVVVAEFAESLMEIPRSLLRNAGINSIEGSAQLELEHLRNYNAANAVHTCTIGLNLEISDVERLIDAKTKGIIEPTQGKINIINSATEAAISFLRIHDSVVLQATPQQ